MKSPLAYMGGKSRMVKTLVPMIHKIPHTCYCEPFCGAAWVLFGKDPEVSECEIINDADGELVSFWRVIQKHYLPFVDIYRSAIVSRQMFEWHKLERPETLTDLERAARYYYLQRLSFGGKVKGRTFGYSATSAPKLDIGSIQSDLLAVHMRLARVTVEHLDGMDCVRRYDRKETLFFLDPPYLDVAGYEVPFPKDRYEELADLLAGIAGRFILTLNNHPQIRETFKRFKIAEIQTSYSTGLDAKQRVTELLITNR